MHVFMKSKGMDQYVDIDDDDDEELELKEATLVTYNATPTAQSRETRRRTPHLVLEALF
ncbi:hypothetical protein JCGZ_13548 [Jatropha curcas]|uniref:Uncharacterized protein n=1 Tax=Jatropha curcas TaxID=180498 RepID=A0A067KMS4_JATCU|nr:hypothetical protein JCGZ_13548 [Jatropha curcas]